MNIHQKRILDIYKDFKGIADSQGYRFFAIGGTALGAVRHNGFIPWDDDLDIAMPVEDYCLFLENASSLLPSKYHIIHGSNTPHYYQVFFKIEDKNTTCIERSTEPFPDRYSGVWIDIMPMCGVPYKLSSRLRFLRTVNRLSLNNTANRMPLSLKYGTRVFSLKLLKGLYYRTKNNDAYYCKWLDTLKGYPFNDSDFTGYTWAPCSGSWLIKTIMRYLSFNVERNSYFLEDQVYPTSWFSDYVDMAFEDTSIRLPIAYDEYLAFQFGDYMIPPPIENRTGHDCYIDIDTPVEFYKNGTKSVPNDYWL